MKYFTTSSPAQVNTYTVNGGEYQAAQQLVDVLEKFAVFLQKPKAHVEIAYWSLHNCDYIVELFGKAKVASCIDGFTPNEWRMVVELHDFDAYVDSSLENDGSNTVSRVLHFCHLNDGSSFTWIHSVL